MEILIVVFVAVLIFCLLWYAISIIPMPAPLSNFKWALYVLLILIAAIWLGDKFGVF